MERNGPNMCSRLDMVPRVKNVFLLSSTKHKILTAHKYQNSHFSGNFMFESSKPVVYLINEC